MLAPLLSRRLGVALVTCLGLAPFALAVPQEEAQKTEAVAPGTEEGPQQEREKDEEKLRAGEGPGEYAKALDTIVVTATRAPMVAFDTPYSGVSVTQKELVERSYRTTPQALRYIPGVMVQETSHGQGSPIIRGFTGYLNLMLIDGVRLNNSVFRSGPNEYWNLIDPLSVQRLELVKGPSSVLYGSDAVGGTVNSITRSPYTDAGDQYGGWLYGRVADGEQSYLGRAELSVTPIPSTGLLAGFSGKEFGDIYGGRDTGKQENTGYHEWDADVKLEHSLDASNRLVFLRQHVEQNNVPRTHSTIFAVPFEGTAVGTDLQRDNDQERILDYLQFHGTSDDSFYERYEANVSWHEMSEVTDRIRGNGVRDKQGFDVGTLGLFANATTETGIGSLTYGFDYYHDDVDSFLDRGAAQTPADEIQGPVADDATYDLAGVYIQDAFDVGEKLTFTLGGRFNYAAADADSVRDPVTNQKISIDDDWSSLVGSLRFTYDISPEDVNLFGGVSQGFRAPNLSDLSRFDSARSNEFEIPAPDLDPEYYLNYELGVKVQREKTSVQTSAFYTDIEDQILRVPTGNVNGAGQTEITKANVGDGYIWGLELGSAYRFVRDWTVFGNATYMEGKVDTFPTSAPVVEREYIDRLMPFTAQLGFRWDEPDGVFWSEIIGVYADDADRLSTRDEQDTQRIPPGGTPSYTVVDLRGGWSVRPDVELLVAVENLFDEDYRVHGSGSNAVGRNFVFSVSFHF
jgi:hemoglobin/transferrin/lactoferrin receptor protein